MIQHYQQAILPQTLKVAQKAKHVQIHEDAMLKLANKIRESNESINTGWTELDFNYHYTGDAEKTAQILFLSSALNFSFWDGKAEELWAVDYQGEWVKGYWALTTALKKAVETHDICNAAFWTKITQDDLAQIFAGQNTPPLLEKRVEVCHNIGRTLLEEFDGQFSNVIKQANQSAVTLTNLVANHFEDFRDIASYQGIETPILKRAQILAADLWGAFKGEDLGTFHDIHKLTIFADYKLPQFLNALGVMTYSPELEEKINNYIVIEHGSDMEVELRACTIQAVHQLKVMLNNQFSDIQLDWWIWNNSFNAEYEQKPHHLTRSIFY